MPSRNRRPPPQSKYNRPNAPRPAPTPVNEGLAAFNRRENPVDTWRIARNWTIRDPTQTIMTIGKATGTHISYDRKFEFHIWGPLEKVRHARVVLESNILQDNPTFQHHKQDVGPSRDTPFDTMRQGLFVWPSEEFAPDRELGQRNFERLDPIRIEHDCMIDYDVSRSSFVVKGAVSDVQQALIRIKGLLCKAVAQNSPVQRLYLVQNDCQHVVLRDHALSAVLEIGSKLAPRSAKAVDCVAARSKPEDIALNAKQIKDQVMQTLSKVHWHQGHIDFRVHLGTLTLTNFKPFKSIDLSSYKDMLSDSYNFRGKVTDELGDKDIEESLLRRFKSATSFLDPCQRDISDIADTKPVYTATLEVDLRDNGGHLLIAKRWWHTDNGLLTESDPEYKRMDGNSGPTKFLELCLSDTLSDRTWQLDISALRLQEPGRLPDWALNHGNYHIHLIHSQAQKEESFCDFESYNGKPRTVANKRSMREAIIWRFDMKAPYLGYEVEVAKVFRREYTACALPGKEPVTRYEPRWTVDVKHRRWSEQLAENHELSAGYGAEWEADIQSWFPVDSDDRDEKLNGHVKLLRALQCVQDIALGKSHSE
ncbi:hypothetical protein E4T39_03022 [Aureobasidium subglaciale]|nr:hypothetical protein E4T39_03022 [Aureobasidium subglaciale]